MSPIFLQATTTIILISLLISTPTITTASDIVQDANSNPVVSGTYYYIVTIFLAPLGSGISMFNNGTHSCPSFIVSHSNLDYYFGIPVKFTPQLPNQQNLVITSTNLNIDFKFLTPEPMCRRRYTTVWTVSGPENGNAVVLDGELGSDGSWFKLEDNYPTFPSNCYSILYGDKVVLYEQHENGQILLGLDKGNPLIIVLIPESDVFPPELLAKKYKVLQNLSIDKSHSI